MQHNTERRRSPETPRERLDNEVELGKLTRREKRMLREMDWADWTVAKKARRDLRLLDRWRRKSSKRAAKKARKFARWKRRERRRLGNISE